MDASWPFSIMVCVGMICSTTIIVSVFEYHNKKREFDRQDLELRKLREGKN